MLQKRYTYSCTKLQCTIQSKKRCSLLISPIDISSVVVNLCFCYNPVLKNSYNFCC